jgi:hypothetical protein
MNYSTSPEVIKPDCEEICQWWRFFQGSETAMQDLVIPPIFKKFNTLCDYTAENIKKIEE